MHTQTIFNLLKVSGLLTATLATSLVANFNAPAHASCDQYLGRASNGLGITLDQCSITKVGNQTVEFIYYLGQEQIQAQADCATRSWTVFPEGIVNRPGSRATQEMLRSVCNSAGPVYYYTPPGRSRR